MSALTANSMGILARNRVAMAATTDLTKPNLAVLPVFNRSVSMLLVNGDGQDTDVAEMVNGNVIIVIVSIYRFFLEILLKYIPATYRYYLCTSWINNNADKRKPI